MTTEESFDAHAVPRFPVYNLEIHEDSPAEGEAEPRVRVLFNGTPVEPRAGYDPVDAGYAAVAMHLRTKNMDAVRVLARDGENVATLVITAGGHVEDITEEAPDLETSSVKRAKARTLLLVASCTVLVLGAAGGALAWGALSPTMTPESAPTQTAAPLPPGAGTAVPVGLPPEFSPTADWAVPITENSGITVLSDDTILTANPDGQLVALDPATATEVWKGQNAPKDVTTIRETTWQGRPFLATASTSTLTMWVRDMPDTTTPALEVTPSADFTASFAGTAPLLDLGDYTIAVPTTEPDSLTTRTVTVPPGTWPVAAGEDIAVSIGPGTITRTALTDAADAGTTSFTLPEGAAGRPTEARGLTATRALATWRTGNDSVTVLLATDTGQVLAETRDRVDLTAEPLLDTNAHTALIGDVFVDYGSEPALHVLDRLTDPALHGHTLYGQTRDSPAAVTIAPDGPTEHAWQTYTDDDVTPTAVTDDAAYVIVEKLDQQILYRAPRLPETTATPSEGNQS